MPDEGRLGCPACGQYGQSPVQGPTDVKSCHGGLTLAAQRLAHFPTAGRESSGRAKVRKLMGQDKDNLISERDGKEGCKGLAKERCETEGRRKS